MSLPGPHFVTHLLLGSTAGFVAGLLYFTALARNVRLYVQGGHRSEAVLLHLLRLTLAVLLFFGMAKVGPDALLASLVLFLVARTWVLRSRRLPA